MAGENEASKTSGDERRRTERVHFAIELTIKASNKSIEYDETYDISVGGIFVVTADPLTLGTEGEFAINLSPELPTISGKFKVATISKKGGKSGMGITFTGLNDDSSLELYRVVRYNQPDGK